MKKHIAVMAAAIAGAVSGTTYNVPADGTLNDVVPAAQSGDEVVIAASDEPYVLTAALTVPAGVTVRGAWNPNRVDIGAAVYDCKGLMLMLK